MKPVGDAVLVKKSKPFQAEHSAMMPTQTSIFG